MKTLNKISVGDILVCTWGYEACLANFYRVVARTDKSIKVRELDQIRTGGWIEGTAAPKINPDVFLGEVIKTVRVKSHQHHKDPNLFIEYVRIDDHFCTKWSGVPVATFNHH